MTDLKTIKNIVRTSDALIVRMKSNQKELALTYKDGSLLIRMVVPLKDVSLWISYTPLNWCYFIKKRILTLFEN